MAIYFVQSGEFVKIGYSANPKKRVNGLQTGNPHRLVLLGTMPGGDEMGRNLHKEFRRYRHDREWFRADDDLIHAIAGMLRLQGALRSVRNELIRRMYCRYGLRGVQVAHRNVPNTDFVINSTEWGANQELLVTLYPPNTKQTVLLNGEPLKTNSYSASDLERMDFINPPGALVDVRADDVLLMSAWPIPCPCWVEPGEKEDDF